MGPRYGVTRRAPRRIFASHAAHLRCCPFRSPLTHQRRRSPRCSAARSIWTTCAANLSPRPPRMTPSAPARHLIKKNANRKLYDTRTSRYITLDEIAQLVRGGDEIKVVDRDNGSDLTQVTLSQIVLSEEKRGPSRIVDAGDDMLHDRGQALLDYVRKTLNVPADLRTQVGRRREGLERMADDAIQRALRRLRIPTRRDIDRINDRLDRLTTQLKRAGLSNGSVTRPRRRKASR